MKKYKWTTISESLNMFLCYIVFVCISQCDVNHYGSERNKEKLKIFDNVQFCFAISYVTSYNNAKAINEHSLFGFCNKSRGEQGYSILIIKFLFIAITSANWNLSLLVYLLQKEFKVVG